MPLSKALIRLAGKFGVKKRTGVPTKLSKAGIVGIDEAAALGLAVNGAVCLLSSPLHFYDDLQQCMQRTLNNYL